MFLCRMLYFGNKEDGFINILRRMYIFECDQIIIGLFNQISLLDRSAKIRIIILAASDYESSDAVVEHLTKKFRDHTCANNDTELNQEQFAKILKNLELQLKKHEEKISQNLKVIMIKNLF